MHCIFLFSGGFFIALHSFPLYGWLGNLSIMERLLVPIILTYFTPPFWGLHFDTLCLCCLISYLWGMKILNQRKLSPSQHGCCPFTLAAGTAATGAVGRWAGELPVSWAWRGFILLISTCWSLCQLVWAATVLGWFDSRDVGTRATIRPLLAQT